MAEVSFDINTILAQMTAPQAPTKRPADMTIEELEGTLGEMGYQIYPTLGGHVRVRVEKVNRGEPVAVVQAESDMEVSAADGNGMEAYRMALVGVLRMTGAFENRY